MANKFCVFLKYTVKFNDIKRVQVGQEISYAM